MRIDPARCHLHEWDFGDWGGEESARRHRVRNLRGHNHLKEQAMVSWNAILRDEMRERNLVDTSLAFLPSHLQ